jgi:hypothetical protein
MPRRMQDGPQRVSDQFWRQKNSVTKLGDVFTLHLPYLTWTQSYQTRFSPFYTYL